jgi:Xaa-Pro dipeptidase
MRLEISQEVYEERIAHACEALAQRNARTLVLFSAKKIAYLFGYHVVPTERPLAIVLSQNGDVFAFLPRLEVASAEQVSSIGEIESYFDYPGETPLLGQFAAILTRKGLSDGKIVVDSDGYPALYGYTGPRLSELLPTTEIEVAPEIIAQMWWVKSPQEIELIRTSAVWGNLAHAKLQEGIYPGASEIEVSLRASYAASAEMLLALGPDYGRHFRGGIPTHAGLISGERTALPHAMSLNRRIRVGDLIITGASASIGGYVSELERTLIVGDLTPEQEHFFSVMLEAQTIGIEASGPGVPLSEVDRKVMDYLVQAGMEAYLQHHTGHHLGYEGHEPPFIDRASTETMQIGQVFSIEPGIYVPGHGGYRHSDTILITEEGVEMLTYYPRSLEELIIPV